MMVEGALKTEKLTKRIPGVTLARGATGANVLGPQARLEPGGAGQGERGLPHTESVYGQFAPRRCSAFTLIELLVVIAIIGLLAAITVPAINAMRRSDAMTAATRQLLDDVGRARQLAISKHTTVYMIFVPRSFWTDPAYAPSLNALPAAAKARETARGERLYDKQLVGYNFVTLRSVGDQPGQISPDYLSAWHTLPEGTFIATNKMFELPTQFYTITDPPGSGNPDRSFRVYGFSLTNNIPFPSEETYVAGRTYAAVPYIAFNFLGQLVSGPANYDEFLPLARGTVAHARDPQTKKAVQDVPILGEVPSGNSTNAFHLIQIDRLTGRARLVTQEISGT